MLKKLAVLAAALAVSAPALADRGYDHGRGHAYGHGYGHPHRTVVVHKQPRYVVHRPAPLVVHHYHYRPAPAPRPVYVVEQHNHVNPVAFLAGAVIGAAIVHHAVTHY
jgi:hypothetical protein